jgi:hypothetical protein
LTDLTLIPSINFCYFIDDHDNKIEEIYKTPVYKLATSENQKAFRDKNPKIYSMSKEQQLAFKAP